MIKFSHTETLGKVVEQATLMGVEALTPPLLKYCLLIAEADPRAARLARAPDACAPQVVDCMDWAQQYIANQEYPDLRAAFNNLWLDCATQHAKFFQPTGEFYRVLAQTLKHSLPGSTFVAHPRAEDQVKHDTNSCFVAPIVGKNARGQEYNAFLLGMHVGNYTTHYDTEFTLVAYFDHMNIEFSRFVYDYRKSHINC